MITKTKVSLIVTVLVLLVATAALLLTLNNGNGSKDKKSDRTENTTSTTNQSSTPDSTQPELPSTTSNSNISISISSPVNDQSFENEMVPVRAIIYGATEGTCTATFNKQGSEDIVLNADVVQGPTYFTCAGFDVENTKFQSKGTWELIMEVDAPNGSAKSDTRKIVIK
ncbi:MAG: hypothetical protein U0R17_02610 [Acidimicrobiia bacterium]